MTMRCLRGGGGASDGYMKIERPTEGKLSLLQRQRESEASSSNGTGHAHGYGLCFCNVELSVCRGHVGCEKQLRRVSSTLGIGIKRTKSLDSPLAVHSTENTSLYPSGDRVGGCSRFGAALSIAVVVLWLVLHLAHRPESYCIRQERSSSSTGGNHWLSTSVVTSKTQGPAFSIMGS